MALREEQKISHTLLGIFFLLLVVVVGYMMFGRNYGTLQRGEYDEFVEETTEADPQFSLRVKELLTPEVYELKGRIGGRGAEQVKGVSTNASVPFAPEEMKVFDPQTGRLLNVFWKAPSKGAVASYRVYRSESEGFLGTLIADLLKETFFQDRQVVDGVPYYYTIRSVNAGGEESQNIKQISAVASDTQAPGSPTNVSVKDTGEGGVLILSWKNPPDQDFKGVNIYRSSVEGALGQLIVSNVSNTTTFRDQKLRDGEETFYTITAVDDAGNESPTSLSRSAGGRTNPFEPVLP